MQNIIKRFDTTGEYKEICEKGPEFKDQIFPPVTASLGQDEDIEAMQKKGLKWKRAREIYKTAKLFRGVDVNDIVQGELGTCYFLSAITGVCENPNRIMKLFATNKENPYGCYAVTLYIAGAPRTIVVDDHFLAYDRRWAATCSREEEIWVMVIEKAWAKAHGAYGTICGGDSRESLSSLTGAPTTLLKHGDKSKDILWKVLKDATRRKFIMSSGGAKQVKGLYSGHAYSMLKAIEVNTQNMGAVRLVQIRNPWGEMEWNGDWSDKSPLWTPELRAQAGSNSAEDGTFFMPFDDYYNLYSYSFICQCVDTYIHSHTIVEENEACAVFQTFSETKGFFSCHQMTSRMAGTKGTKLLVLELYAFKDNGLQLVKGAINETDQISFATNPAGSNAIGYSTIEAVLPPGLYVMHAYYYEKDVSPVKYLCFTAYASKGVDIINLPGKTSVKSITRAELMKTVEEYMSKKEIKVEPKAPAVGTPEHCPNGHAVTFMGPTSGAFRCDLCKGQRDRQEGRYSCATCMYDVCIQCRPPPPGTAPKKIPEPEKKAEVKPVPAPAPPKYQVPVPAKKDITTCKKGHNLTCGKPARFADRLFICCSCGRANRFTTPKWICEQCAYLLCDNCKPANAAPASSAIAPPPSKTEPVPAPKPAAPAAPEAPAANEPTCIKKHKLYFDFTIYPDNVYFCDVCDRQGRCTQGRWRCKLCNYDVCTHCIPAKAMPAKSAVVIEKGSPVSASVTTTCLQGHMLWYSTYSYLSGLYECNKCFGRANCADGRWFCIQCEYDICPNCRPAPPDVEKYKKFCNNGHPMVQSISRYSDDATHYRCSFCHKAKSVEDNRWWCPICGYDVCNECSEKDIENVEWPEPIEDEERRCKDKKHEFVLCKEPIGNFECQNEGQSVSNTKKYLCLKCGMSQCEKCAKENGTIIVESVYVETGDKKMIPGQIAHEFKQITPSAGNIVELDDGFATSSEVAQPVTAKTESEKTKEPAKKPHETNAACCLVL